MNEKTIETLKVALEALENVQGCFSAASVEGLHQIIADSTDERLKDLVSRRLMYVFLPAVDASIKLRTLIATIEAQPVQPVDHLIKASRYRGEVPIAPHVCPITGRKFWGNISHPELGYVATYGGPFDTYTIPTIRDDGELRCERYDQDEGWWIEGGDPVGWFSKDQ